MISDFELLSQKVGELAQLAVALRRENAGLRASLAVSEADKLALVQRMDMAQQRVATLLARLPAAVEGDADQPADGGLDGEIDNDVEIGNEIEDGIASGIDHPVGDRTGSRIDAKSRSAEMS